ncbi:MULTISPECIES: circadian clock protein KaiA [unclassified Synechococcus]|uniref:circadian clock protein KaiA n=1 Tax=unclassified Synechococcus TaxID=2626047 RepID=UPI000069938A|nr:MULTISPECIES: circadian clock protein KaiA [unclassified Synechococcus]EAQ76116.1 possible circadian clock protein KaiA [Synechococcus sp. WH 5701]WFN58827.1 circadian clock protein KaiA [Synechococcus sp. CCFWC 502]
MTQPALTVASLIRDEQLRQACSTWLPQGRYELMELGLQQDPAAELERCWEQFDAVLLEPGVLSIEAFQRLRAQGRILPAVVLGQLSGPMEFFQDEVHLPPDQMEQLSYSLDAAISRCLRRRSSSGSGGGLEASDSHAGESDQSNWRLPHRLRERLGYLGIFYKRDSSRFLRNLSAAERKVLLRSLQRTYRDLLISYFRDPAAANQALESFVNTAFFSDLPITKTVEIHVDMIDEFWKKLQLEGHKQDFLKDYRLALLDVMAHLCEMYRRSLPPEVTDKPSEGMVAKIITASQVQS